MIEIPELVTIPKKVAESIERIWDTNRWNKNVLKAMYLTNWMLIHKEHPDEYETVSQYAAENPVKYMTAVADGYEVEVTAEDRILKYYNNCKKHMNEYNGGLICPWYTRMLAIRTTLDLLDKKIPGINDK